MKAMTTAVSAVVLSCGLAGCPGRDVPGGGTVPDPGGDTAADAVDGTWCGTPGATGPVYLNVTYLPNGMPQVRPVECTVASNTNVTWRGPNGEPVEFEVAFKGARPIGHDDGSPLTAVDSRGRYKVKRTISGPIATYPYGVKANGKELDPAIIIDR